MSIIETRPRFSPEDIASLPAGQVFELIDEEAGEVGGRIYELADDASTEGDGRLFERINGQFVERRMGWLASWVGGEVHARLREHCRAHDLGWVVPADATYRCFPDAPRKLRSPDVSFVRRGRFPGERLPTTHARLAPDLAVEVISPTDFAVDVDKKVDEFLRVGVRLVWVINPDRRRVLIYRADGSISGLREADELSGEDVIPGFRCRVGELFPPPAANEDGQEN
jgi:Uma2 family endonuclease